MLQGCLCRTDEQVLHQIPSQSTHEFAHEEAGVMRDNQEREKDWMKLVLCLAAARDILLHSQSVAYEKCQVRISLRVLSTILFV